MTSRRVRAALVLEVEHMRRDPSFVLLVMLAALTFLATVSLFGLTGSELPLAIVDKDGSAYAARLEHAIGAVRHAFSVRRMDAAGAEEALRSGQVLGSVTIPARFGEAVERGDTSLVRVRVDNLNVDLTSDLERALPNAILAFGEEQGFAGLRVQLLEKDLVPRETGFLAYVAVSALGLDAFVIAMVLAALAMAREWEGRTAKLLRLAGAGPLEIVVGKALAAAAVATLAIAATTLLVIVGYGVRPAHPAAAALALLLCVTSFACMGTCVGAWLKKTMAVVPLVFGVAMPLYVDSGALEPTRFDGERIWLLAHASPLYYATGLLEWAFHGVRITPEAPWIDAAVLVGLAPLSALLACAAFAGQARGGGR
jgi:ABC-2 type transport system permease protein